MTYFLGPISTFVSKSGITGHIPLQTMVIDNCRKHMLVLGDIN